MNAPRRYRDQEGSNSCDRISLDDAIALTGQWHLKPRENRHECNEIDRFDQEEFEYARHDMIRFSKRMNT